MLVVKAPVFSTNCTNCYTINTTTINMAVATNASVVIEVAVATVPKLAQPYLQQSNYFQKKMNFHHQQYESKAIFHLISITNKLAPTIAKVPAAAEGEYQL